jgi:hypothetical protein
LIFRFINTWHLFSTTDDSFNFIHFLISSNLLQSHNVTRGHHWNSTTIFTCCNVSLVRDTQNCSLLDTFSHINKGCSCSSVFHVLSLFYFQFESLM